MLEIILFDILTNLPTVSSITSQVIGSYSVCPFVKTQISLFSSTTTEFGLSPTSKIETTMSFSMSIIETVLSKLNPPELHT